MKTTKIYLIRHGQSVFQANNDYFTSHLGGSLPEIDLSEKGIEEASKLNKRFRDLGYKFNAVYSSTATRTKMTADVACDNIFPLEKIISMDYFSEISNGEVEGKLLSEIDPKLLNQKDKTVDFKMPGGESLLDVEKRMMYGIRKILPSGRPSAHEKIAIFSHSRAIKCALHGILDYKIPSNFHIKNTSITELEYKNNEWCVIRIGDASHLEKSISDRVQ